MSTSSPVPRWHPEHPANLSPAVRAFLDAADADRQDWHRHLGDLALNAAAAAFVSTVVALLVLCAAAMLTGTPLQ